MLEFLPKKPPSLSWVLEQLGNPSTVALAKILKVSDRTVRRWKERDYAPMPVMWTLYGLTSHGRTERELKALDKADLYANLVHCLQEELLRTQIEVHRLSARLEQVDQAANGPLYRLAHIPPNRGLPEGVPKIHEVFAKG